MQTLLDRAQIDQFVSAIADEIAADPTLHTPGEPLALVGIRSHGEDIAARIAARLAAVAHKPVASIDVGALDITMYRDDLASRSKITVPQGTEMNFGLDDRPVILVDDVLATGRSVRAALDALVDFGRPRLIRLAVLIDRGGREYPIAADYIGVHMPDLDPARKIVVKMKPSDDADCVMLA